MNKGLLTLISSIGLFHAVSSSAQCVVASTDFDTSTDLCCPILTPDEDGWYSEDLDWKTLCKSNMFVGPEYAVQGGIGGAFSSQASDNMTKVDDVFHLGSQIQKGDGQYGYSTVTAQPKLIHSFCKANDDANNMYVNVGSADNSQFLTYTVYGLNPGSDVELSFTLYNLLDPSYFEYLTDNVLGGTKIMLDFITKYNISNTGNITGQPLGLGVISTDQDISYNTGYNNSIQLQPTTKYTSATAGFGKSTVVTHKAKVTATGSISFLFFRTGDCFQIPIGIDDIKVTGSIKPVITSTGNPCPQMPMRVITKSTYPSGTKFSWKESVTGQTSTDPSFNFTPDAAETDYSISLEVTLPGCTPSKADVYPVHSGTCCTNDDGAPMAKTNLFFDDFGSFPSDDTYEWTDRFGVTHTVKIPAGQVHEAQSHTGNPKIPYVKAYNIEASGATLTVPPLGTGGKTELYNHGAYAVSKYGGYPQGVQYDNSGTQIGGMLQFDLLDNGTQDNFFEIDVEHICTGKEISFGADFASISNHPGSIEVVLEHSGNVLDSQYKYFSGGADGWKNASNSFVINSSDVGGASEVTITMKVRHYGKMEDGSDITGETRDYAIDNIIFQVCTPPDVNVESSVSTGKDILDLCTEDVLKLTSVTSEAVKRFYLYSNKQLDPNKEVGYVYQYTFQDPSTESDTNPITWETLHREEVVKTESFDVKVEDYWDDIFSQLGDDPTHEKRIYFRVVVGEYSDLIADQSWKKNSAFSPCRKISISTIPVVAGLNCAACEKVKEASIISADPSTVITTNANGEKEVHLCLGEIAHLTTEKFAPTDPTVMGITVGSDKEPRKYLASWIRGRKEAAGKPGAGYTPGDETSSFDVTWENADKYYLLVKDIEFPGEDGQSCWVYDSINVIGYDKPTDKLTDPAPFCEGMLSSEPDKSMSGFKIQWYESDADTTASAEIPEPEIGKVKKADMPKTFHYVVTDENGCRGEVNDYEVVVNKAERNNVESGSKIEYRKNDAKGGKTLKPLDQQNARVFNAAQTTAGHKLMIGLIVGAEESTTPDTATATFGTASTTMPTPAVKDADNSDDEYLWYYTYLETDEGCVSDTVLVGVAIMGAPAPKTENAEYCVNSTTVRAMKSYATPSVEDPTGTLVFYGTDKTTTMDGDDLPDVTAPGKYTYWVSQVSSTGGGESSKQPVEIEVYGVSGVTISPASDKYCKGSTEAKLDGLASEVASGDSYVKSSGWEYFKGTEPAANEKTAGAESTMDISTAETGQIEYFARMTYTIASTGEVCYGAHKKFTAEVQSVDDPITNPITYLKSEGASGGFRAPLAQNPDGVIGDASCGDCSIEWYSDAAGTTKITEAQATPIYDSNLQGNDEKTYYVKQVNSLGCESSLVPVKIIVSGYPTPTVKNISVCENSDRFTGEIQATINGTTADPAGHFKLVWYKQDPVTKQADKTVEFNWIDFDANKHQSLSEDIPTIYTYYVLQRLLDPYQPVAGQVAESALVPMTVTVYPTPKLTKLVTDPKCKGENQKLSEMYTVQPVDCEVYKLNQSTSEKLPSDEVTEAGIYEVTGSYVINKGQADEETCKSLTEELKVVFHELDAGIVGSDRTCPGVGVDLDADVTVGGGLALNEVMYSWSNDLNSTAETTKTYNTGAGGLNAAGDIMKVTVEVSSPACKGSYAVKKTHAIKVGDGPLIGNISFSEPKNSETKSELISSRNISFNSCGGKVSVELSGIANKDGGSYTLSGDASESGSFGSETSGTATLSLGEGSYTVEFVNECPTKFSFEIIDYSNTARSTNHDMTICEDEKWFAEILDIKGPSPRIEWKHDGVPMAGETGTKIQFNQSKPSDSGVYTYALYSAGCEYNGKIALGDALKVKPIAEFKSSSYQTRYEVVNGKQLQIDMDFNVPANKNDIDADVTWKDQSAGFSAKTSSVTIDPVTRDYNLHVVAENDDYCKAEAEIAVLVDAKLKIEAELERVLMCEGETNHIYVDTTGTGKILHPEGFVFTVTEVTSSGSKTISLHRDGDRLSGEISPTSDAQYTVTYTYTSDSQDESVTLPLTVKEKFQVEIAEVDPVCEGDIATVTVKNVYPSGTTLDWSDNPSDEYVNGSMSGATFEPKHDQGGVAPQVKRYSVVAKNGLCQDKAFPFTIEVHKPISGEIESADKICQYDKLELDASSFQADTYEWRYEDIDSVFVGSTPTLVPIPDFATFTLNMTRGKCSLEVSKTVEVTSAPSVMQVDSLGYRQIEVQMEFGLGTEPFSYIIDGNDKASDLESPIKDGLEYREHTVKVVDAVGCTTEYKFRVNEPAIEIPFVVSPDDNGVNDKFIVKGLAEGYPEAKVTIFDRWGKQLATYNAGDGTDWDGFYNGIAMPSTDYWYEIQIKEIQKTYTGHFTLIRQ